MASDYSSAEALVGEKRNLIVFHFIALNTQNLNKCNKRDKSKPKKIEGSK
jgi:hypothetical protein